MELENFLVFALVFSISLVVLGSGAVNQITPLVFASLDGNLPPNTVTPSINTSQGTNTPLDPVNCYAIVTDPNGDSLNVSIRWYNNNLLRYTSSFYRLYTNGSLVKDTYYSALSGDTIRCTMQVSDNRLSTDWISSSSLLIQGTNPTCSDGTVYNSCSVTKPKFCMSGVLRDFCAICGCPTGLSCNISNSACYNASGQPTPQVCSDGTPYGSCSATKPKFCSSGTLINKCSSCNCPTGYLCNSTTETCYIPQQNQTQQNQTCMDGTPYNQCSITKPKLCLNGNLINSCTVCGCAIGLSCNATSNACFTPQQNQSLTCSDGTPSGQCSAIKSKYCDNGNLVYRCSSCGCQGSLKCNTTTNSCYNPSQQPRTRISALGDEGTNLLDDKEYAVLEMNQTTGFSPEGNYIIEFREATPVERLAELQYEVKEIQGQAQALEEEAKTIMGPKRVSRNTQAAYLENLAASNEQGIKTEVVKQRQKLDEEQSLALNDLINRIPDKTGFKIIQKYGAVFNGALINVSESDLIALSNSPYVKNIYPNSEVKASLSDSVPRIGAPEVWAMTDPSGQTVTGKGIRVAIIDTGIDYTHPDLGGCLGPSCRVIGGWDYVNNDANPMDDMGHGTHCAGIVGANGVLKGVAPDVKFYAYKVLGADGSGSMANVVKAIEKAMDPNGDGDYSDHANVISMSLGSTGGCGSDCVAVKNAVNAGVVVVVAAGNSGPIFGSVGSPGLAPEAVTVGATCKPGSTSSYCDGQLAWFSSRGVTGMAAVKPELSAPGVSIYSTVPASGQLGSPTRYATMSGTSMATPHVAGAAALLVQAHPDWTPEQVKSALITGSRPISEPMLWAGAGELYVPNSTSQDVFMYQSPFMFGSLNQNTKSFSVYNAAQARTFTVSSQDRLSLYANKTKSDLRTDRSTVQSPLTIAQASSAAISLSIDTNPAFKEAYYDGYVMLKDQTKETRLPFLYYDLSVLTVHVLDTGGDEISVEDGVTTVYSFPDALTYDGSPYHPRYLTTLPWTFVLPAGNYTAQAMTGLSYFSPSISDRFILSDTISLARGEKRDLYLKMADAHPVQINLTTEDGLPMQIRSLFIYWRYFGKDYSLRVDELGEDSIYTQSIFSMPKSMTIYLSDNNAHVGIGLQGLSYSPTMWDFMYYNWQRWYEENDRNVITGAPSTHRYPSATADRQYLLSWEFKNESTSFPRVLNMNKSELSIYNAKLDIQGTQFHAWAPENFKTLGGNAVMWSRADTGAAIDPVFSGMTRTIYVQGAFSNLYEPNGIIYGDEQIKYFTDNFSGSLGTIRGYPTLFYSPSYTHLTLPPRTTDTRLGACPFYPSIATNNTPTSLVLIQPTLGTRGSTRWIGAEVYPKLELYRQGSLYSSTTLAEYFAHPYLSTMRVVDGLPSGSYTGMINVSASPEICTHVQIIFGFTLPATDMNPPQVTAFSMPQRFAPGGTIPITISAADDKSSVSITMKWRSGTGSWTNLPLTGLGAGNFSGTIQTSASDSVIEITYNVSDSAGNYISFTQRNAAFKETPVLFNIAVSQNASVIEYKGLPTSVLLTGYLTTASGTPLHSLSNVPLELKVGNKKVAMILDDYNTGTNWVHNGTIRFDWTFNPLKVFNSSDQTIQVDVDFDLGAYQNVKKSFTMHSIYSQICSDGTPYGACSLTKPKYCDNGQLVDRCYSCACQNANEKCNAQTGACYPNSPPSNPTPSLTTFSGKNTSTDLLMCSSPIYDPDGDAPSLCMRWYKNGNYPTEICTSYSYASGSNTTQMYPLITTGTKPGDVWECWMKACDSNACSSGVKSNPLVILPNSTVAPTCSDGTQYSQCSATKPKYCDNGQLVDRCSSCSCSAGLSCHASGICYIPNSPPATPQPFLVSALGKNTTQEDLACSAQVSDADGDAMNSTIYWYNNSSLYAVNQYNNLSNGNFSTATIKSGNLSAGQKWQCKMIVTDGKANSSWGESNNVTIRNPPGVNSPPNDPRPSLVSYDGSNTVASDLLCYDTIADIDNDRVNATVAWYKGGVLNSTANYNNNYPSLYNFNISLTLLPTDIEPGQYSAMLKLDAPNATMSKRSTVWLLENPPYVVSQEGPSASRIFEYIIALILIEFVFGSIVMVIWYKPPQEKLPPLPQIGSDLKPVKPDEWWKRR